MAKAFLRSVDVSGEGSCNVRNRQFLDGCMVHLLAKTITYARFLKCPTLALEEL